LSVGGRSPTLSWSHPSTGPTRAAGPQASTSISGGRPHLRCRWRWGPPPTMPEEPLRVQEPATLGRSQRSRRPPRYLADYHVGHMEMSPQRSGTPSTGKNSEPQRQNSPDSTGRLQKQQPPHRHSHLANSHPALSGHVGRGRRRYPIPMNCLDPTQETEDEATTLLPAQLIRAGATATTTELTTTQPLRVALAWLGNDPGPPGSQKEEKIRPAHPQLPRHWQSRAPPYRESVLDTVIQAWSRILDRCTAEIESLVHQLK